MSNANTSRTTDTQDYIMDEVAEAMKHIDLDQPSRSGGRNLVTLMLILVAHIMKLRVKKEG